MRNWLGLVERRMADRGNLRVVQLCAAGSESVGRDIYPATIDRAAKTANHRMFNLQVFVADSGSSAADKSGTDYTAPSTLVSGGDPIGALLVLRYSRLQ